MRVEKIFVADNGDIFFKHDSMHTNKTKQEVAELMANAYLMYNNKSVEIIKCECRECFKPVQCLLYKTVDGEFVGESGMHVDTEFSPFNDMIYLKRVSGETESNGIFKAIRSGKINSSNYQSVL